ncbi:hypothetical protein B7755_020880 [Streptomyces sp. NBS 14/10]|uniref:hypothetical protein n=1 Tax=Streptomyces sp. NBS 14/10 TaxID=1945643 RepID=UPI000B7EBC1B|nr:hypothetical protein [Streptomyces sp. NBS 14/10]KAK1180382.1 hypothetical protein B7755_020880 [Streptomyces sp. NBS 14/10]
MSVANAIAWILKTLLRLLLPPSGRHRAANSADGRPAMRHQDAPTMRPARGPDAPARPMAAERADDSLIQFCRLSGTPDGHGAAMVRPYVVAHEQQREQRAERRLRRRRRRTLWLAVHGIDIGPRVIHGVRVVA